jgi:hypothetical protein
VSPEPDPELEPCAKTGAYGASVKGGGRAVWIHLKESGSLPKIPLFQSAISKTKKKGRDAALRDSALSVRYQSETNCDVFSFWKGQGSNTFTTSKVYSALAKARNLFTRACHQARQPLLLQHLQDRGGRRPVLNPECVNDKVVLGIDSVPVF